MATTSCTESIAVKPEMTEVQKLIQQAQIQRKFENDNRCDATEHKLPLCSAREREELKRILGLREWQFEQGRRRRVVQQVRPMTQCPKRFAKAEMDALTSVATGMVTNVAGAIIDKGLQTAGKAIKTTFGANHDSPAIASNDADNLAIVDLPRVVSSLAFKSGDFVGDVGANFSANVQRDPHDLLARVKIPSRLMLMHWSKANAVGDEIGGPENVDRNKTDNYIPVGPQVPFECTASPDRQYIHTALSASSLMYKMWRGSLIYTIECLPTKFHQGQLFICFQPWEVIRDPASGTIKPTFSQARNNAGATIDLSLSNRTRIVVPYNATTDYRQTTAGGSTRGSGATNFTMGMLLIFVQNPLSGPDNVTDTIDVNVWIEAGEDFEFVTPRELVDQVSINGSWLEMGDEYSEIIIDTKVAPPIQLPPTGHAPATFREVAVDCNVRPADLTTIANRPYLLTTGINWTTSQTELQVIARLDIGQLFGAQIFSIAGLVNYHNFFRSDFEITLRMNAQPFLTGMLAFFYTPAGRTFSNQQINFMGPTLNQLPLGFYTPASDTSVTLKVPWTNRRRVMTTQVFNSATNELGTIYVVVYNPLRAGTGGTTTITGAIWGRMLDPYFGLKKADFSVTGVTSDVSAYNIVEEMEQPDPVSDNPIEGPESTAEVNPEGGIQVAGEQSSDTQLNTATAGRIVPLFQKLMGGFVRNRHMNVLELLRRPERIRVVTTNSSANSPLRQLRWTAGYPVNQGKTHAYLRGCYHAWNGTTRIYVRTLVSHAHGILLTAQARFNANNAPDYAQLPNDYQTFDGLISWKPALESQKIIGIPYYAIAPTLYTWGYSTVTGPQGPDFNAIGADFYIDQSTQFPEELKYFYSESIGDDYHLYVPLPFPPTRVSGVSLDDVEEEMGWIRDLTCEGVEPNPGPVEEQPGGLDQETQELVDAISKDDGFSKKDQKKLDKEVKKLASKGWFQLPSFIKAIWNWITKRGEAAARPFVIKRIGEELRKGVNDFMSKVLPVVIWIMDFIGNLYTIFSAECSAARALALTALAAKCLSAYHYGTTLLLQLNQVGITEEMSEGEGPQYDPSFYTKIAALVATTLVAGTMGLLGYGLCKKDAKQVRDTTEWKVCETAAGLAKLNSGVKASKELWQLIRQSVESGVSWLIEGEDTTKQWQEKNSRKILEWTNSAEQLFLVNAFDSNNVFKVVEGKLNYQRLEDLVVFAKEIKAFAANSKLLSVSVIRLADRVLDAYSHAHKSYTTMVGRVEPIGIFVEGKAGCGKSVLWTRFLPGLIMKKCGIISKLVDAKRNIYTKPSDPEHKYLDGYMSQPWVSVDDFMAGKEDKDALQMINMISVATCPVNMADIADKRTVFDSRFICATSNQKEARVAESIRDKSALVRRFPFAYHQKVKPEYLSGDNGDKFDMQKFQENFTVAKHTDITLLELIDQVWFFYPLNLNTGSIGMVNPITARQIVQDIVDCYNSRKLYDDAIDDALATMEGPENLWAMFVRENTKPEVDRIKLKSYFEECVLPERTVQDHNRASELMWMGYQYNREGILDYEHAQSILSNIQLDAVLLGYRSSAQLFGMAHSERPCDQCAIASYTYEGEESFLRFVRMLGDIEPEELSGPPRKKWPGLARYLLSVCGVALAVGAVAVTTMWALRQAINLLKAAVSYTMSNVTEEGPAYDPQGSREPIRKPLGKTSIKTVFGKPEAGEEELLDTHRAVQKAIRKIRYVYQIEEGRQECRNLNCVALDNRTIIFQSHFFDAYQQAPDNRSFEIQVQDRQGTSIGWLPIRCEPLNTRQIVETGVFEGTRDLVVLKLIGAVVQHARNIRSLVITREEKDNLSSQFAAWFLDPLGEDQKQRSVIDFRKRLNVPSKLKKESRIYLEAHIAGTSGPGDCGRPYVLRNSGMHRPLVGTHALNLGGNGRGISDFTLDAIEAAEKIISMYITTPPAVEEMSLVGDFARHPQMPEGVVSLGRVEYNGEDLGRFQPVDTALCRTGLGHKEWLDDFVPTTKKTIHVGGVKVVPLYTNLGKFVNKQRLAIPLKAHRQAIEYMKKEIGSDGRGKLLTEHEIINGYEHLQHLVLNTSCGYLQKYYSKGKTELFEELPQQEKDGLLEPLEHKLSQVALERQIPLFGMSFSEHIQKIEQDIKESKAPVTFFLATTKDELTSHHKAAIGKTRIFLASGLDLTFLIRKYFGAFMNYYLHHPGFKFRHAIGTDKNAVWGKVLQGLEEQGGKGFDIDFSNYDGTVPLAAVEAFLEVVQNYYKDDHWEVRNAIFHAVVNSTIIAGQFVIEKDVGIPSGIVATEITNTVENFYLMSISFQLSKASAGLQMNMDGFDETRMLAYGDDVVIGAPDGVLVYFNRQTIRDILAEVGMTVTAATKDADIISEEPIRNLSFLKSRFVERPGYIAAPLPLAVVHRELQWGKKTNDGDVLILAQKVDMAMQMIAHHGKEAVEVLRMQLLEQKIKTDFSFPLWELEIRDLQERSKFEFQGPGTEVLDTFLCDPESGEQFSEDVEVDIDSFFLP